MVHGQIVITNGATTLVSISYIGMVLKTNNFVPVSVMMYCINLLYRYGTGVLGCMGWALIVSISYIGMVQQHFVVVFIITTKFHAVNGNFWKLPFILLVNVRILWACFWLLG